MSARTPGSLAKGTPSPARAPETTTKRAGWRTLALAATVGLGVILAHWPVFGARALALDDDVFMVRNPLVQKPGWESTRRFFIEVTHPSTVSAYYLPLSMTSLMLDWAAGGRPDRLRPFHVTSLGLHVAAALLLYLILRLLFGAEPVAALVALAWAVHPVMVEALGSAGERKTVLATACAFAAVHAHVHFARSGRRAWWAASIAWLLVALLSKPSALALPLALCVVDAWPLRRWSRECLLEKWPHFALAAAAAVVSVLAVRNTWEFGTPPPLDPPRMLLQVVWLQGFYLGKLLWPGSLATVYEAPARFAPGLPSVTLPIAAAFLVLGLALALRRRMPGLLAGGAVFGVLLAPTFAILRYSQVIAYDRYLHLPTLGLAMALASALAAPWMRAQSAGRVALTLPVLALLGAEALATHRAWRPWTDTLSLWQHAVMVSPGVPDAWNGLGATYSAAGDREQAIEAYRRAIAVGPDYVDGHYNLGREYMLDGRVTEALPLLEFAATRSPGRASNHLELGLAYQRQGRLPEAEARYRRALELRPEMVTALIQLGQVEAIQGRRADGVRHLREALRLSPGEPLASYVLAGVLDADVGPNAESVALLEQAIAGKPRWPDPVAGLAAELAALNRFDEAAAAGERALALAHAAGDSSSVAELERRIAGYRRAATSARVKH